MAVWLYEAYWSDGLTRAIEADTIRDAAKMAFNARNWDAVRIQRVRDLHETGAYGIRSVSPSTDGAFICGTCGRAWLEDITPAGRCPWEDRHV
jgi:hypothetical protein